MAVDLGPKLNQLINADIAEIYYNQFRPFLRAIDALLQGNVINASTSTPPVSPSNGDAYIVTGSPTGAWTGKLNNVAVWSTEITEEGNNTKVPGWDFYIPNAGWLFYDVATSQTLQFNGTAWNPLPSGGGGGNTLQTVGYSSTPVFNGTSADGFEITLNGDVSSSTAINMAGKSIVTFRIQQDGAGDWLFVWPTTVRNPGTVNPTANSRSVQIFAVASDGTMDPLADMQYTF